ncbi:MAG: hypothetical protein GF364_15320 [Candidatus Lokiarchaeota archaeon]|nr:hypothetical protein [Candidatus Lokiarchaeota archaeon]
MKDDETYKISDKWEDIGYHRVIGGFYYNIVFALLAIGYVLILPLLVPYPESMGFYNILTGIFSSIFTFADFGLASALSRYIAEYRVKDKLRTIQYIRFFIWFQAFTGLAQTTVISLIGLYALRNTSLSFMPWMFLWLSTIQYPGWLGVFNEALKGFQQYGKVALAGLLNTVIFQTITLVIGAQLGAYIGELNPRIGGIMGSSIGLVIGYYVDDFTTTIITGQMFAKVLKPMGFRLRDVLIPRIRKEVAFESLKFGIGVMLFVISYQSVGSILALIYARDLPNYSTYVGILSILSPVIGLAETVNGMHIGNHRSTVSEAYFNEKPNYAVYLLSNGFRTMGQMTMLITPLALLISPMVVEFIYPDYINIFYKIFLWKIIFSTIFQHSHLMNEVLIGTGNHKFNIAITVAEQLVTLIASIICIKLELGIFVLIFPGFFQTALKQGLGWWYINNKIIDLKINPWQNWIATGMAGILYFMVIYFLKWLFSFTLTPLITNIGTIAVLVLLGIYILPGLFYFLPVGLFGGYDTHTLTDFEKAVELSGPSKFIIKMWYKGAEFGSKKSKLHNKFPMAYDNVENEVNELMEMKKQVDTIDDRKK